MSLPTAPDGDIDETTVFSERVREYRTLVHSPWEDALQVGVPGSGAEANQARLERALSLKRLHSELTDRVFASNPTGTYDPTPEEIFGLDHVIAAEGDLGRVLADPTFVPYLNSALHRNYREQLRDWEQYEGDGDWPRPRRPTPSDLADVRADLREVLEQSGALTRPTLEPGGDLPPVAPQPGELATRAAALRETAVGEPAAHERPGLAARAAQLRELAAQDRATPPAPPTPHVPPTPSQDLRP
ncbi:hypothetical protein [Miniimonas sp. S16]|uniref:hypothetical protein n=1 Tax=Miniimonas sp. S16 TaxID=2171623 RepID=UPI000D526612|nr:hypothetical protein [Miniimonas sp. S16]